MKDHQSVTADEIRAFGHLAEPIWLIGNGEVITYRWDVMYGQSAEQRAQELELSPKLRRDGELDMRYRDMRWLKKYRADPASMDISLILTGA